MYLFMGIDLASMMHLPAPTYKGDTINLLAISIYLHSRSTCAIADTAGIYILLVLSHVGALPLKQYFQPLIYCQKTFCHYKLIH
jgi:hypothetical protein